MQTLPKKAIQDYTELYDIVRLHEFEGIEYVLTSAFMDTKAEIIRKDEDEHYIDLNYKSIAVTIVPDANWMATISPTSVEYYEEDETTQYLENKEKKVGEVCICPVCGETFTKKQWQQAFCCGTCKDKFWNSKGDRHTKDYYTKRSEKIVEKCLKDNERKKAEKRKRMQGTLYDLAVWV